MTVWKNRCVLLGLIVSWANTSFAVEPRVMIEGAQLELVAANPVIATPIGMTFDAEGRLLVIESHTHEPEEDYEGPKGDRIRIFSDSDGDGQLDKWSTFAEGFQQSMNLFAAGPGKVYLATRRSVDLLIDEDGDGRMDRQESILRLETEGDYPHNGLSGISVDDQGGLFVGLGENFGFTYRMVGSDGSSFSDRGGVGAIFHCDAGGKNLRRFSSGFWNPFSICVLPGGQVFMVDNDPDASPPCRLIHVVESGDYGLRWEYSRTGIHPLQAWNGELPGTLPMVAGVGEAPCAVVPHRGSLWVTSWGDHRLERYQLNRRGVSFGAERQVAVQGDSDFRPTGCAVAPDGSLYFSDWVDLDYSVHGQGRIWRLSFEDEAERTEVLPVEVQDDLEEHQVWESTDLYERQREILDLSREIKVSDTPAGESSNERLGQAQAYRWSGKEVSDKLFRAWLKDEYADVRLNAVRWIADERRVSLRDGVAELLDGEIPDERYYLAVLSALEWLDNEPGLRTASFNDGMLAQELQNEKRTPRLHALALRLILPNNELLTLKRLEGYLASDFQPLRLEAVRTLVLQENPERFELLASVAKDVEQSELVRAEAVAGLAASEKHAEVLASLAEDENEVVRQEAQRVQGLLGLRPAKVEEKPAATDLAAWNRLLAEPGNAAAGRRLFFSARGARCGVCHQHRGRGGRVGPDLTRIQQSNSREQIIASILQPSREIAPHYQPWVLQTDAGKTLVGLRLHKIGDDGNEIYADTNGKIFGLRGDEIELRQASDISIMPAGLETTVSIDQLRDLVEFLRTAQ